MDEEHIEYKKIHPDHCPLLSRYSSNEKKMCTGPGIPLFCKECINGKKYIIEYIYLEENIIPPKIEIVHDFSKEVLIKRFLNDKDDKE